MKSKLQLTVGLLKPDIAGNPTIVSLIEQEILKKKFYILKRKVVRWQKRDSEMFYKQHKENFFYRRLVDCMTSGPIIALLLAKENGITDWRKLMGPTKVYKSQFTDPNTIRGRFGLTDTRNTVHGSDSVQSAAEETSFFFPDFNANKWLEQLDLGEEPIFDPTSSHHIFGDQHNNDYQSSDAAKNLMMNLGMKEAWSNFYNSSDESREWFVSYKDIKDHLDNIIHHNSCQNALDIGCGTSSLGPTLAEKHSDLSVYCLDASIECLVKLSTQFPQCTYVVCDICNQLPFATCSIDMVIDKGTSEAILRHCDGKKQFGMLMKEVFRVLKPNGIFVQITTEPPEVRLDDLRCSETQINVSFTEIGTESNSLKVYMYFVKKHNSEETDT
uniref:Nucleoside diphosphate kinase n=1 Tax=Phallusia mammillata TaxID=59560 RepID=A0A6F9DIY5_9ASCI|nr:uncharacterized protein LOC100185269 [Phallusia mammillata]